MLAGILVAQLPSRQVRLQELASPGGEVPPVPEPPAAALRQ